MKQFITDFTYYHTKFFVPAYALSSPLALRAYMKDEYAVPIGHIVEKQYPPQPSPDKLGMNFYLTYRRMCDEIGQYLLF